MKTALRVVALIFTALMGLWALGHGIGLVAALHALPGGHEDFQRHLIEGGVSIAGGVCVLSVAVERLYCWRTHRKDGGLI